MAFIYNNLSNDKTLMIGPNESLIYPFYFTGWNELRLGAECYLTASSGANFTGQTYNEFIPTITSGTTGSFLFGFINTGSGGFNPFPIKTGTISTFLGAGFATLPNDGDNYIYVGAQSSFFSSGAGFNYGSIVRRDLIGLPDIFTMRMGTIISNKAPSENNYFYFKNSVASVYAQDYFPNLVHFRVGNIVTSGSYIIRNGVSCKILNQGTSLQSGELFFAGENTYSLPNMNGLNSFLSFMENLTYPYEKSLVGSGSYTDDGTSTGNYLPLPNAIFINNPSPIHNLAITNLSVLKYS